MSWRTLDSRSGEPRWPRKYFETTTFVAICDQNRGISTSFCSKTTSPRSLVMMAERVSHSQVSYTSTPGLVNQRSTAMPPVRVSFFLGGFDAFDERLRSDGVVSIDVMFLLSQFGEKNRGRKL